MYFLVCNPKVQVKAQTYISDALGSRPPSMKDKPMLPYIVAIIYESLRYGSMSPMGIARVTAEDSELGSYKIGRGTMVCLA